MPWDLPETSDEVQGGLLLALLDALAVSELERETLFSRYWEGCSFSEVGSRIKEEEARVADLHDSVLRSFAESYGDECGRRFKQYLQSRLTNASGSGDSWTVPDTPPHPEEARGP